jgi:hypothetical protein
MSQHMQSRFVHAHIFIYIWTQILIKNATQLILPISVYNS